MPIKRRWMVADGARDSIRMRSIAPADHRRRGPVVGRQFDRRRPGSDGPPWSIVALGWPHCRPRPRKIDSSYNAQENFRWYRDAATRLGYMDCSHALTAANGVDRDYTIRLYPPMHNFVVRKFCGGRLIAISLYHILKIITSFTKYSNKYDIQENKRE